MKVPHPGELRHRIEIGKTFSVTNENGFPTETDSVLFNVWAGVEDSSSHWKHEADADQSERGLYFNIRWIETVAPGMWVRWNGEKYLITRVEEYDFKRRYMRLTTKRMEGVH